MLLSIRTMHEFKTKFSFWWVGLISFAIILRLIFASFLFHTDVKGHYQEAQLTQTNIREGYERGVEEKTPLHYPPVIYVLYNSHRFIDGWMFSPYFSDWLNDTSFLHLEHNPKIFRDLLAMKLPIILFDFLTALVLVLLAPVGKKRLAGALWLLNPFSIYAIYFFGQFDIIAAFLVLLSIFLWHKNKYNFSYLVLGLAAAVKVFPLLLLPVFLIYDPRAKLKKLLGIIIFALTFLICLAPIITSAIALKSVFLSNLTGGLFKASIDLGGGKLLPIYLVVYLFILSSLFLGYIKKPVIESVIFILLSLLLVLSDFHPQWMVWIMPLMIILLVNRIIGWVESLVFLLSYMGVSLLIDDKFVLLGTLKAVNQSFDSIPSIRFFFDKVGIGIQIQSLFNALLLVTTGIFSFQIFKNIDNFKSVNFSKINFNLLIPVWIFSIALFIVAAHLPLVYFGKLIDTSKPNEQSRIILTEKTSVSEVIKISHNNFNAIEFRLKNINLKNTSDITISLSGENGGAILNETINGGAIGDDYNLLLKFPAIADSKDKNFILKISESLPVPVGTELVLPYDNEALNSELMVNEKPLQGSLSYTTFYSTGNLIDNLNYSFNSVLKKL